MVSMNTRLNIEKLDEDIVQKHGGSKQVGLKQLGYKQVELLGAQRDRKAEVFPVSNNDTVVAQRRLEDKQLEEKTNTDCLSGLSNVFWEKDTTRCCMDLSLIVEPLRDHTFDVEPQENIDQGAGLQEVQTQDLIDYQLARDRKQHLACELFEYREDNNEDAFEVAVVEKIYAHESLTFNNIVVCEVISKWKAGLKDDMDARSDVYVLSNGSRKCSDDIDGYYWKYTMIHNEKLVQTLLKRHSTLSLEDSLSMDCYVKNMIRGSLKANLQHMEALLTTEVGYVTFTEA
nr:zinc finger, CCHC-type [Tanacetum cinerariifolium]